MDAAGDFFGMTFIICKIPVRNINQYFSIWS